MKYLEEIKAQITPDDYWNCRLWDGKKVRGVPVLRIDGEEIYLRKHIWLETNSLIPRGFQVKMVCENFECVNPNHMVLVPINALVDWHKLAPEPEVSRVFGISKRNRANFEKMKAQKERQKGGSSDLFAYAESSQDL